MRIIGGKYKGMRLFSPETEDIRPTSDKVRESIFDTIQFDLEGSVFVDLFAGSGAMGIEAAGRGARSVYFVDASSAAIALIKKNLAVTGCEGEVVRGDFAAAAARINQKADIVFADPPYAEGRLEKICRAVDGILAEGGMLIYEHSLASDGDGKRRGRSDCDKARKSEGRTSNDGDACGGVPQGWELFKSKRYGKVVVDYLRRKKRLCAVTGSFDPLTLGHLSLVRHAARDFDAVTVVLAVNADKSPLLDIQTRKAIVETATADLPNVSVDVCDGMIYEYCNSRGIDTLMRGFRNERDYAYEREMARFNAEHGGVVTLIMRAEDGLEFVNSGDVRAALERGESIAELVPKSAVEAVNAAYDALIKKGAE